MSGFSPGSAVGADAVFACAVFSAAAF